MSKAVSYARVSKSVDHRGSYGLEAQRDEIREYCDKNGIEIVSEHSEVGSGVDSEREGLDEAIRSSIDHGCPIISIRVDRISRSVKHFSSLLESGIDIIVTECPGASTYVLHQMVAAAEHERALNSDRVKRALAIAKKRGVKLGSARPGHWDGMEEARERGYKKGVKAARKSRMKEFDEFHLRYYKEVIELHSKGMSCNKIAEKFNEEGRPRPKGGVWHHQTVRRILAIRLSFDDDGVQ